MGTGEDCRGTKGIVRRSGALFPMRFGNSSLKPHLAVARATGGRLVVISFFFSSRRRHTRFDCDWSSDVCSSDLVLTNYQNQTIGQQLIRAAQEFFEENKAALQGCVTYPASPKHLFLFHKFGYKPKALTAVMSRTIDRTPPQAAVTKPSKAALAGRRFSALEETKKKATLARMHPITNAICRGMDLSKEVELVDGLALRSEEHTS